MATTGGSTTASISSASRVNQVLEEAARRIEEDTPWYEKLGLAFEESEGVREVTVEMVLASNVAQGLIEAASKTMLAPAFEALKGLIGTVQDAATAREEVLELTKYCVGISKCLVDTAKGGQLPPDMITKLEEFQYEMEAIKKFVEAFGAQTGFFRKVLLGSRNRSTAAKHKSNLQDILNVAVIGHIIDTNRVISTIAETLEDRNPPRLNGLADIPPSVPSLPKAYVERTDMQETAVSGLGNEDRNATATVSLWGMGGGGKTVLASSVVRDNRVRSSFKHGMFWYHIGQEGKASVALILRDLARELAVAPTDAPHLCPSKFDNADEAARHVSTIITAKHLRCLVVLDNVWDVEVVNIFASTGIHVLVTTRERTVIPPMYRGLMVEVGDMKEEEGLELLRKASHAYGPLPTEAKQVADDCSMLPLALSMAGAMAKDQPLDASSWRTLHETLQEKDFKLEEMRLEEMTSQSKSIFSTIYASVDILPRTVREQLRLMVVMASGVPADSEMLASLWDVVTSDVKTGANILVDRSLLQVVDEKYRLHDLVLEYLQMTVKKDLGRKASSRQARFLSRIEVLRRYSAGGEWFSSGGIYSLVALWSAAKKFDESLIVEELYRISLRGGTEAEDMRNAGWLLDLLGKYDDAEPLYKRALAIREETLGPRHPNVALTLNNLAGLLQSQGKYDDAEPLYKRALAIYEETLGPRHPYVATSLNNLAGLLKSQGKYDDAEPLCKRALAIKEETLGPRHPDVAFTLNNLACLLESQGKYDDAEPLCKRALAIREETLGPRHPNVATTLNNLAGLLKSQGKYDAAKPLYKRAHAICEETLGPRHPNVATTLNDLACLLESQGKYDDAEPLYKRSLAISEETLGPQHPDVAATLNNLAGLLESQGKYDDAEPLHKRALTIDEETLGPRHPDVATTLNNLAGLLRSQGKYDDAESLYKRALAIREETLSPRHPDVGVTLNNLAGLLRSQGKYDDAEPLYKRALTTCEETLGPRHPDVAATLNNLAGLLESQGKCDDAEPLYKRALAIRVETLGPRHPALASTLNDMAALLQSQGKYDDAEPLYKRALAIDEETQGRRHPNVATTLNNLAGLLESQGKYDDAEPLYKRALAIREGTLGPRNPDVAVTLNNLAGLLKSQGKYDDAEPLYKRALAIREETLGPRHPDVASTLNNLAGLLKSQGKYDDAKPLYKRALPIREETLGPQHPNVATTLNSLADLLQSQGNYDDAEPLYNRAFTIYEETLGPRHPNMAITLNNLAGLLQSQGKYDDAESRYKRALAICEETLGPRHPHVAKTLNNQAGLLEAQGNYDDAEPLYKRALAIYEETLGPRHPNVATTLNDLAALLESQGKYDDAEPLYKHALAIKEETLGPRHPDETLAHQIRQREAKTLTAIVDAKAAAKQDSAEIKQKKAKDEASNTRMGSWAVGQGNARCVPTARATQFGEARTNDERAYRTLTGQGTGSGSSGRASPALSTGGMSSSLLATGGGGSSGRSSPTPNTDEDSDASRTPAYGGSSGRSSPTTTAGGTGSPSQARAGSGCGGRSGTVPPLGDELARVLSSPTISVLATRAGVTREQADLFLNSGFTSDLVPPDKAVAMMTLVVNDWLNEKREFATVDNYLSDMVEGGELEIEVPGFDGSVLHELLKNYGVSRDQFYNIPNAYHFANGWHAENNPTGAKFDKVTEQLAKLLTGPGGSTPARPAAAAGKTTGGEAGAGAVGNAGFSSRPDGAVGNRGRKPRNNKRKLQEDGTEGFMQQQLVDARQIADQRRQDDDKKEAAEGSARRREFEERLTFERTMREEEREAARKDRDRERAENRDDLAAERAYQLKFLELQVQLANAKNKAQS